jgi:hypothetical protein
MNGMMRHNLFNAQVLVVVGQPRRLFTVIHRRSPNYPGHVPLDPLERVGLAIGSSIASLVNPYRHGIYLYLFDGPSIS